jgi:hypothetical protein
MRPISSGSSSRSAEIKPGAKIHRRRTEEALSVLEKREQGQALAARAPPVWWAISGGKIDFAFKIAGTIFTKVFLISHLRIRSLTAQQGGFCVFHGAYKG